MTTRPVSLYHNTALQLLEATADWRSVAKAFVLPSADGKNAAAYDGCSPAQLAMIGTSAGTNLKQDGQQTMSVLKKT